MEIPMILSGAAGRALRSLEPVSAMADQVGRIMGRATGDTAANVSIYTRVDPARLDPGVARTIINGARGDLQRALGVARQGAFSAEMHAATQTIDSGIASIGRLNAVAHVGADAVHHVQGGVAGVQAGMTELRGLATQTAARRVGIGLLGAGLGIAGLTALSRHDSANSKPMAPGPLGHGVPGFDPSFDPTGVVL